MRAWARIAAFVVMGLFPLVWAHASSEVQPGGQVILFSAGELPNLEARLEAELRLAGFRVTRARAETTPALRWLPEAIARRGAAAGVFVERAQQGLDIWVTEAHASRVLVRRVARYVSDDAEVMATAALHAGELVRASLLELDVQPVASATSAASAREEVALTHQEVPIAESEAPARRHLLAVGPALLASRGGVSPATSLCMLYIYGFSRRQNAQAAILLPLLEGTLRGPEGHAGVAQLALRLTYGFVPWQNTSFWTGVGAGVGVALTRVQGEGTEPFIGRESRHIALMPEGLVEAGHVLGGSWAVMARLSVSTSVPQMRVTFADRDAGGWGAFVGTGVFALGARF